MTQEEIISMACEAGIIEGFKDVHPSIERFAKLVAEKERNRICKQIAALHDSLSLASDPASFCARGQQ